MSIESYTIPALEMPQAVPAPLVSDGRRRGFGEAFTNSMASAQWREKSGWQSLLVDERRPLVIDPAMVALHYGQIVFEGLKAHLLPDGRMGVFRPDEYGRRLMNSAARFAMPAPPLEMFIAAVTSLAARDGHWLHGDPAASLYLRPILFATEPCLALRPARAYAFIVVAFVTGGFFSDYADPITVKVERDFVRAARGGTGSAKCAGNYAPAYLAQELAAVDGADQVVWLDALERRFIEELGGMNLFFVYATGNGTVISTPPLSDTILPGVTRQSLMCLARRLGYRVEERQIDVGSWRDGVASGNITETFACGTAATVTPIGAVLDAGASWQIGGGSAGPVCRRLRTELQKAWMGLSGPAAEWVWTVESANGE